MRRVVCGPSTSSSGHHGPHDLPPRVQLDDRLREVSSASSKNPKWLESRNTRSLAGLFPPLPLHGLRDPFRALRAPLRGLRAREEAKVLERFGKV